MKHLFLIHSNTVFLSALGAINYEGMESSDIIFFYARNFSSDYTPKDISVYDVSKEYSWAQNRDSNYNPYKLHRLVKDMDAAIDKYVAKEYIAYVPHTIGPCQPIITNKYCKGIRLMQEGAFTFYGKKHKVFNIFIKNLLFSNKRVWFQSSWDIPKSRKSKIKIQKTYATNKKYFEQEHNANHIVIKWPKIVDERLSFPKGTNFFLFESAIELKQIDKRHYLIGCERLIKDSNVKKCYIKFHPNQREENVNEILALFEGVDYTVFSLNVPFELIISSNSNLNLYGFSTSLIKFGEDYGHHVVNYTQLLCELSRDFKKYIDSMC